MSVMVSQRAFIILATEENERLRAELNAKDAELACLRAENEKLREALALADEALDDVRGLRDGCGCCGNGVTAGPEMESWAKAVAAIAALSSSPPAPTTSELPAGDEISSSSKVST